MLEQLSFVVLLSCSRSLASFHWFILFGTYLHFCSVCIPKPCLHEKELEKELDAEWVLGLVKTQPDVLLVLFPHLLPVGARVESLVGAGVTSGVGSGVGGVGASVGAGVGSAVVGACVGDAVGDGIGVEAIGTELGVGVG